MRTRPIAGVDVPIIGQGTWMMEIDHRPTAIASLRYGIELGMTHIDTAEMYGSGKVEAIVGEAIAGCRDEVYLVSKVLPQNASHEGTVRACEGSLKRLGTDYLDLYLLHWPGPVPRAATIEALYELREAGKIRAFGVSNFDVDDLKEAWNLAGSDIACNQVLYHLEERGMEHRVLPWCQDYGIPLVAYSPFGQGRFPAEGVGGGTLESIADSRGASRYQVALAYLTRHAGSLVIPKASQAVHVAQNAGGDFTLTNDEVARIDVAFPLPATGALSTL